MAGQNARDEMLYFAYADDAWERDARIMAGVYNLGISVASMLGAKDLQGRTADDYNDSLRGPDDLTSEQRIREQELAIIAERKAAQRGEC